MCRLFFLIVIVSLSQNLYGLTWQEETVDDAAGSGTRSCIAVSKTGYPGISYYDTVGKTLKYAYRDNAGWHTVTVDNSGDLTGEYNSLVMNSNDQPRIIYYDATNQILKYAYKNTGSWSTMVVEADGVGKFGWLTISEKGEIAASYYDMINHALKFAVRDASSWSNVIADGPGRTLDGETSIALDDDGNPYISYYDSVNNKLRYAWRGFDGWDLQVVDSEGIYNSIGVTSGRKPIISYYDAANKVLKLARRESSGWMIEVLDDTSLDVGKNLSMVLDKNNNPHIVYLDAENSEIIYGRRTAAGWISEVAGLASTDSKRFSLVLDASGKPHISYGDAADNSLCYLTVPNDEPAASSDYGVVDEDASIDINVCDNDSDSDGDAICVGAVGGAGHGTTQINANGTIKYTPDADFNGADNFSYTITDGVKTASASVFVTVNSVNDLPVVTITNPADHAGFYTGKTITIMTNAVDTDGDIQRVEYYNGTTLLANCSTAPFTFTWDNATADDYAITARAYDEEGAYGISQTINIKVERDPDDVRPVKIISGCSPVGIVIMFGLIESFLIIQAPKRGRRLY